MNLRKSESIEIVCELLNLPHLHLWCSQPLVVLVGRPPFFSRLADLLASKHSSDICYPGCAAPYHFLCYGLQSWPSGEVEPSSFLSAPPSPLSCA